MEYLGALPAFPYLSLYIPDKRNLFALKPRTHLGSFTRKNV